mgnify:CR=1 FL=1
MKWTLAPIDSHLEDIKTLFAKTEGHKHANNYSKWPLFQHTKFARMARDSHLIRIMSRHTRDRQYNFGGLKADLARGLETLDVSTSHAISLGYKDIWVSREENGKLLDYFQHHSKYDWIITQEEIPLGGIQWVMRLA